jgi:hypothetical protein
MTVRAAGPSDPGRDKAFVPASSLAFIGAPFFVAPAAFAQWSGLPARARQPAAAWSPLPEFA